MPAYLSQEIHLLGPGMATLVTPLRDPVSDDGRRHKRAMREPTGVVVVPPGPGDAVVLALRSKLLAARDFGLAAVPSAVEALNGGRVIPTREVRGLDPPGLARPGAACFESPIIEASLFDVLRDTVGDQVRIYGAWCVRCGSSEAIGPILALVSVGCRASMQVGCWTCWGIGPMTIPSPPCVRLVAL